MYLVDHCGEIVAIDTLLETIWMDRMGEPAYVRKAIHEIRTALHDAEGRIIKTLPRVGYIIESEIVEERVSTEETLNPPGSPGQPLVYGRLSSNAYEGISRRLRRSHKDTTS
jgi:DNA-binding winged helix-turn-helix (wHTH) protein